MWLEGVAISIVINHRPMSISPLIMIFNCWLLSYPRLLIISSMAVNLVGFPCVAKSSFSLTRPSWAIWSWKILQQKRWRPGSAVRCLEMVIIEWLMVVHSDSYFGQYYWLLGDNLVHHLLVGDLIHHFLSPMILDWQAYTCVYWQSRCVYIYNYITVSQ